MPAVDTGVPRWAAPASTALAAAGLAVSVHLTVEHFTASATLACPASGAVNCQKVTTSEQAVLFGIPVAILGTIFFLAMLGACLPASWRSHTRAVGRARLALAAAGAAFVVYLVYAELFLINAVCLWCTAAHVLALGLFAVVAVATAATEPPQPDRSARPPRGN